MKLELTDAEAKALEYLLRDILDEYSDDMGEVRDILGGIDCEIWLIHDKLFRSMNF